MASREARKDGEATRLRILEAAGELCATLGFGETSNKAVAAKAEVDLASINYHFGSRNGLYQAVLGRPVDAFSTSPTCSGSSRASRRRRTSCLR